MANFLSDARAALRVADAALVVVDAVPGVEVSTEKVWEAAEELGAAAHHRAQPARPRARQPRALARVAARRVRPRGHADPAADRRGEGLRRRRRSGGDEGVHVRQRRQRQGRRTARSPAACSTTANAAREALIEMVAEADDALMEKFFDEGTLTQEELSPGCKRGVAAGAHLPGRAARRRRPTSACQPLLDAIVSYVPSPAERPLRARTDDGERQSRCHGRRRRRPSAFVWKTVADPFAGRITLFRVVSGTLKADSTVHNVTPGRPGAARPPDPAAGQDADQRPGDQGRRHRRRRQAEGDADQRHARRQGRGVRRCRAIKFPEPVISYAIEPKSRGDEEKISTALHRLQEEDPTISYTRDAQTKELLLAGQGQSHIEVTVAKLKRRFGVEVNAQAAAHPLPRDHQGGGRGARPAQEADRRPRPVRRLQGQVRAAAARQRLRVRRRHLRRLDPAAVHAGGREGDPGLAHARLPRRLPDGRLPRHGLRRLVPPRRLERAVVQDGRVARLQGRHVAGPPDAARADHERRGLRAERVRRRPDGRPEQPPRPDRRHGHARRDDGHPGQGADVRDAHLRAAPDLSDRRPRLVPHGVLPLRGGAGAPPGEDHRGRQGRARARRRPKRSDVRA